MKKHNQTPLLRAFSMVEMAISVTLISIIMGLILMVTKSAENAHLLTVAGEYRAFQKAVKSFNNYYDGYPGDLINAYDFFGSDCGSDSSVESGGCNGSGNHIVDTSKESYKTAQHLYLAKLVSKAYSGSATSGDYGDKYINSIYRQGYYSPMIHASVSYSSGANGSLSTKHFIVFGAKPSNNSAPYDPLLTPAEAEQLDVKIDDGKAFRGNVQIRYDNATSCNGTDGNQVGNYDLDNENQVCNLLLYVE